VEPTPCERPIGACAKQRLVGTSWIPLEVTTDPGPRCPGDGDVSLNPALAVTDEHQTRGDIPDPKSTELRGSKTGREEDREHSPVSGPFRGVEIGRLGQSDHLRFGEETRK
jgi:hypothetical protein